MNKIHGGDIYSFDKDKGIIDFSSNINPLGVRKDVICEIKKNIYNVEIYPDTRCQKLRYAISEKERINMDYIICGNGAAELIYHIIFALKPKTGLFIIPSFSEYEYAADVLSVKKKYYAVKEENNFDILSDIIEYINNDTDIVFLCNPNNPTGRLAEQDIILKIIDKCEKTGTVIVIDECFMDFVQKEKIYSSVKHIKDYNNLIVLKAFTKTYALPGLRLGYALLRDKEKIERIYSSRQPWSVSSLAQTAGEAALKESGYEKRARELIMREKEYIKKEFEKLGIKYFESYANFILFKEREGLDKEIIKHNILIRNCGNFKGLCEGYYRVAVKRRSENEKLIGALKKLIGKE